MLWESWSKGTFPKAGNLSVSQDLASILVDTVVTLCKVTHSLLSLLDLIMDVGQIRCLAEHFDECIPLGLKLCQCTKGILQAGGVLVLLVLVILVLVDAHGLVVGFLKV